MENSAAVEYYCAREHITRVNFYAEAILDVPQSWECSTCFQPAYRTLAEQPHLDHAKTTTEAFTIEHQNEFHKRRDKVESEKLLAVALEKLRARESE